MRRRFSSYKEAAELARDLAYEMGETIRVARGEGGFFVEMPESCQLSDDTDDGPVITYEAYKEDEFFTRFKSDVELLQEEISDELSGFTSSSALGEEDGWFYDDED